MIQERVDNKKESECGQLNDDSKTNLTIKDFRLIKVIGVGSYGKVLLVRKEKSNKEYALKILRKDFIAKKNQVEHTKTERNVLEKINHPFIVRLRYAFQNSKKLYFVIDYCPGGELFFHLQRCLRFDEDLTKFYAAQIVLAIEELHKHNIIYRDLKPENVLIDFDGYIKITDFGLSKENITHNTAANSFCGTPEYLAPEILNRIGHGKPVDWWSLGAIIYEMITGLPPFFSQNKERLFQNIRICELTYPSYMSTACKDLLKKLFVKDPNYRLGSFGRDAEEIKIHPWFKDLNWDILLKKGYKPPKRPIIANDKIANNFSVEFTGLPPIDSICIDSQENNHYNYSDIYEKFSFNEQWTEQPKSI